MKELTQSGLLECQISNYYSVIKKMFGKDRLNDLKEAEEQMCSMKDKVVS